MSNSAPKSSNFARWWHLISATFGVRIIVPFSVQLPGGQRIDADVLLVDFGGQRGMLLVTDYEKVRAHGDEIVNAGYGVSVLSDPGDSLKSSLDVESIEGITDMLRDWGWAGAPEDEPIWMRQ